MGINTEYVLLMNQAAFWWATNGKQCLTQAAYNRLLLRGVVRHTNDPNGNEQ